MSFGLRDALQHHATRPTGHDIPFALSLSKCLWACTGASFDKLRMIG